MTRAPSYLDDFTGTYARTTHGRRPCTATESIAIHKYTAPAHRRFFYALIKHGWWVAFLAVVLLTGCSDMDSEERGAANLRDAVAQARALPNTVAEVQ